MENTWVGANMEVIEIKSFFTDWGEMKKQTGLLLIT